MDASISDNFRLQHSALIAAYQLSATHHDIAFTSEQIRPAVESMPEELSQKTITLDHLTQLFTAALATFAHRTVRATAFPITLRFMPEYNDVTVGTSMMLLRNKLAFWRKNR